MSLFLLTGTATLHVVNTVERYPQEDEELRASARHVTSGGNAANSAVVLARQGHLSHLCAVLADDPSAVRVRAALETAGVDLRHCSVRAGATPTSYVLINAGNGSRTIVHHRDLPELEAADFTAIPLEDYDWLHFEGRNVTTTARLIRHARRRLRDQPISVEIEKPRPGVHRLFAYADVLIFSRAFAQAYGFDTAPALLTALRLHAPQAILACAWGADGAWALATGDRRGSDCVHAPAHHAGTAINTLGAGDTFNAGFIEALAGGGTLETALTHANQLAGAKVARPSLR